MKPRGRRASLWVAAVLTLLSLRPALAQTPGEGAVPRNPEAEAIFAQGIQAFEEGDYGMAYRRFRMVDQLYDLNRTTTAALLMTGKSLYRDGAYERAIQRLTEFVDRFPNSRYVADAQATIARARQRLAQQGRSAPEQVVLGIALPLSGDVSLTQALFNGIRLAVDEHNDAPPGGMAVQMVFRDTRNDPAAARQAVEALVRGGAGVVVGPLFSEEARAAAAAAEAAGAVLVAPLATEEDVAEGRPNVFQVNPTMTVRGREMARYAVEELSLRQFGIIAELNQSLSERMAKGFEDEARRLDAEVAFVELLPGRRAWAQLPAVIDPERLARATAIYMPMTRGDVGALTRAALASLDSLQAHVRLLGDREWHGEDLGPRAARFGITYANEFLFDGERSDVALFLERYAALAGREPRGEEIRLAVTGYDVARYVLTRMVQAGGKVTAGALREAPRFDGLGVRIFFGGGNVNRALYFHHVTDGGVELLN